MGEQETYGEKGIIVVLFTIENILKPNKGQMAHEMRWTVQILPVRQINPRLSLSCLYKYINWEQIRPQNSAALDQRFQGSIFYFFYFFQFKWIYEKKEYGWPA